MYARLFSMVMFSVLYANALLFAPRAMTARASEPVLATSRTDPAIKAAQIVPDPLSPAPSGRMASATSSLGTL